MINFNRREQNIGALITIFATALISIYIAFPFLNMGNEIAIIATLATSILGSFLFWICTVLYFRKKSNPAMIDYLNLGVQRYILGILMIFYGVPKLLGTFFDYQLFALDNKLLNVSEFQLAWFFYGKNRWLELFSGVMEFLPGIFLFHRKTYYLAALILIPVTSQVFILNFFYKIGGITFPAATILLASNIYIIYSQKAKIVQFFKALNFDIFSPVNIRSITFFKILKVAGILLVVVSTTLQLKSSLVISNEKRNYQKLVGVYNLKTILKNEIKYEPTQSDSNIYRTLYIEKQARWNMLRRFNNETDAFIMDMTNDSIKLYINTNGAGDEKDILDSTSVINGTYKVEGGNFIIKGIQLNDTLELTYIKDNEIKAKKWFW